MNWHEEENRTKLHILNSLARSQRALARIIESMADLAESSASSGASADNLTRQLEAISRFQRQLTEKITGIRIRKFRRGTPGKPWLSGKVRRHS
ncbi:MAG: hypothetical protein K0S39_2919 [Paenibacillus sp.]|jgi:hypothetical protein|nr:hypothetical protein [Paenibacillus sp.]